jgi:hypothetical protein
MQAKSCEMPFSALVMGKTQSINRDLPDRKEHLNRIDVGNSQESSSVNISSTIMTDVEYGFQEI